MLAIPGPSRMPLSASVLRAWVIHASSQLRQREWALQESPSEAAGEELRGGVGNPKRVAESPTRIEERAVSARSARTKTRRGRGRACEGAAARRACVRRPSVLPMRAPVDIAPQPLYSREALKDLVSCLVPSSRQLRPAPRGCVRSPGFNWGLCLRPMF
jgi:hypothetical protein